MNYSDDHINKVICGDALETLQKLPDGIFQSCITSPPYWGLRDYGVDGQLGLESTPEEYTAKMVEIFREVRRTLRYDGTLWLNMGDTYCANVGDGFKPDGGRQRGTLGNKNPFKHPTKPKDLCGIPWMIAFALRNDGWYLRCDIIWSKPNPMPESVTDRPTKAHEYIFLMSKSQRYYYNADAIREPRTCNRDDMRTKGVRTGLGYLGSSLDNSSKDVFFGEGQRQSGETPQGRNARSVWEIATQPYPEAHFATYPQALVNKFILAGTKEGDLILDPFAGSGTTGYRAKELRRRFTMIELNPDYVKLIHKRVQQEVLI